MSSQFLPHFNGKVREIRAMGYNLSSAVLELTDNALTKKCNTRLLTVFLQNSEALLNRVSILDDGVGMTQEQICEAIIFNLIKEREEGDIGKYHVGMKYAGMSTGSQITILSRTVNGNIVGIYIDVEQMSENNTFEPTEFCDNVDETWMRKYISPKIIEKFLSSNSGTCVDIKNLIAARRTPFESTFDEIRKTLVNTYTTLASGTNIILDDLTKQLSVTPVDLFYRCERDKLEEVYSTEFLIYSNGVGFPERVFEKITISRLFNGCTVKKNFWFCKETCLLRTY